MRTEIPQMRKYRRSPRPGESNLKRLITEHPETTEKCSMPTGVTHPDPGRYTKHDASENYRKQCHRQTAKISKFTQGIPDKRAAQSGHRISTKLFPLALIIIIYIYIYIYI